MAKPIKMPELGESITEGTITRWLKQEGDQVEVDEPLFEVSTDKVDTEVPSPMAGTLTAIKVKEDETVDVGTELAEIEPAGEQGGGDGGAEGGGDTEAGDGQATAEAEAPAEEASGDAETEAAEEAPAAEGEAGGEAEAPARAEAGSGAEASAEAGGEASGDGADEAEEEAGAAEAEASAGAETREAAASDDGQASAEARPQADADSSDGGETVTVRMPELGESISEGTITRWLKQEGDQVQADEPLFEVSTDKVDTEVPSPVAGTIQSIKVPQDETVNVGAELVEIATGAGSGRRRRQQPAEASEEGGGEAEAPSGEAQAEAEAPSGEAGRAEHRPPDEDLQERKQDTEEAGEPEPAKAAADTDTAERPAPSDGDGQGRVPEGMVVSPLVRRLAREHRIDLGEIRGTGAGGRVRREDVESYLQQRGSQPAQPAAAEAAPAEERAEEKAPAKRPEAPAREKAPAAAAARPEGSPGLQVAVPLPTGVREEVVKATRTRRLIAERMVTSLQVSAQLTAAVEVDMTKVMRLRERAKDAFKQREGVSLSPLPFCVQAMIAAVRQYPNVNSALDADGNLHVYKDVNLGVAVDTPKGLFVPVIKHADTLNLAGLAKAIADVAGRTRDGKVGPDELSGSTITVTNTGSRGTLWDTPIINQPNAAVFATPAIVRRPVVVDDPELGEVVAVRHMMYAILTYDHRIIDGADAARYLVKVKEVLEQADFSAELGP
jgi:pyruvate dehydrogenase E2 component (dihydrolipoamide acetyltransferase)